MAERAPRSGLRSPLVLRYGDARSRNSRLVLVSIAVAVLAVFSLSGLFYLDLWRSTGQDLSRLLPGDTIAYVAVPPPEAARAYAGSLRRWAPAAEPGRVAGDSAQGDVFGLPLGLARDIVAATDGITLAVVPTRAGPAPMVFVELQDLLRRRRIIARLNPLLEPVARHVGFRIDAIRMPPWHRLLGADVAAPRVVQVNPFLVFAWGPPEGLNRFLEARVAGQSDAIRVRPGFRVVGSGREPDRIRALLDPNLAWALLTGGGSAPGGLLDDLDVAALTSTIDGEEEVLEVLTRLTDRETTERLALAFTPQRHELLFLAPEEAPWVLSVSSERPLAALAMLRETVARVARARPGRDALERVADRLSAIELEALVRLDMGETAAFAGELALIAMPAAGAADDEGGWLIVGRPAEPIAVEGALERLVPFVLGDEYSFGKVRDGAGFLHVARELGAPPRGGEVLVWRIREGLLELASDRETLDRFVAARRDGRTYADSVVAAEALSQLHDEAAVTLIVHPSAVRALRIPLATQVVARLRPDFRVAVSLRPELPWLSVQSNLGAWTSGVVAATGSPHHVSALSLIGMSGSCREAHEVMCAAFPGALPCRSLVLGRRELMARACEALVSGQDQVRGSDADAED